MSEVRFHLDENVSSEVAAQLRRSGISATTSSEAKLLSATDEEQLDYALQNRSVIFTLDQDMLVLARRGKAHAGIVFCRHDRRDIGRIVGFLQLIQAVMSAEEMYGTIHYVQ